MTDKIIRSARLEPRRPLIAALLSLAVPGLGQLYNGQPAKAAVFMLLRAFPVLAVVGAGVSGSIPSCLQSWAAAAAAVLIVSIAAPLEAAIVAARLKRFVPDASSATAGMLLAAIAGTSLFIVSLTLHGNVFDIVRIDTDDMLPTLSRGDIVLVNRRARARAVEGDVVGAVTERGESWGRVIATGGARILVSDGRFTVNGFERPVGVYSRDELARAGYRNLEDIFREAGGGREYAVLLAARDRRQRAPKWETIAERAEMRTVIASDDRRRGRSYALVSRAAITGRVEGILIAASLRRTLALPWFEQRQVTR